MLVLPTCALTAVLAMAVSGQSGVPRLAYNGPSNTAGQAVMGLHAPTTIAPAIVQLNWQGSGLRLHKRAPIGVDAGVEEVDLEKRNILNHPIFNHPILNHPILSYHGQHDPNERIRPNHAYKAPADAKKLKELKEKAQGDKYEKHRLAFEEKRSRETYVYAPLRKWATNVSHRVQNLAGHVVKVFNEKKGNKMLAHTSEDALKEKHEALKKKHEKKMDDIHEKFKAVPPEYYYGSGTKWLSPHYDSLGLKTPLPQSHYVSNHSPRNASDR